jgi:hypothetical protein
VYSSENRDGIDAAAEQSGDRRVCKVGEERCVFRRYQEEMNAVIKSKNAIIEERRFCFRESHVVQTQLTGEKKDVESLKATMQSTTEKMISIQKAHDDQEAAMADLKGELEVWKPLVNKLIGGAHS